MTARHFIFMIVFLIHSMDLGPALASHLFEDASENRFIAEDQEPAKEKTDEEEIKREAETLARFNKYSDRKITLTGNHESRMKEADKTLLAFAKEKHNKQTTSHMTVKDGLELLKKMLEDPDRELTDNVLAFISDNMRIYRAFSEIDPDPKDPKKLTREHSELALKIRKLANDRLKYYGP